jgi:hypothetical protein
MKVKVDRSQLHPVVDRNNADQDITFKAAVREGATGIELKAEQFSLATTRTSVKFEFEEVATFKPGFPLSMKVIYL